MPVDFGAVGGTLSSATHSLQVVSILVFVITLLLGIYYGFHATKHIGVMKMHGWSNGRIGTTLIGRRIALAFGIPTAALVVLALLILGTTGPFVASVMGRAADAVKGRQRTTAILAANPAVKVALSVVLGLLILSWGPVGPVAGATDAIESVGLKAALRRAMGCFIPPVSRGRLHRTGDSPACPGI